MNDALLRAQDSFIQIEVDPSKLALLIQKVFEPMRTKEIKCKELQEYEKWKERGGNNEESQEGSCEKVKKEKNARGKKGSGRE